MKTPELMTLQSVDDPGKDYTAMVLVTPEAVVLNVGIAFKLHRDSVRQVCERLLTLLDAVPALKPTRPEL